MAVFLSNAEMELMNGRAFDVARMAQLKTGIRKKIQAASRQFELLYNSDMFKRDIEIHYAFMLGGPGGAQEDFDVEDL